MKEYVNGIVWGEGLRWHGGNLYFSDIYGQTVYRAAENKKEIVIKLGDMPSGLGFLQDGSMLIVSGGQKKILRLQEGAAHVYADFSDDCVGLNDMVVDAKGHAYIGAYGFEIQHYRGGKAEGWLYHISPSGKDEKVCEGLMAPNGIAVTPDGKTLIVADTFQKALFAFVLDENGTPHGRRLWAKLSSGPDGICLDEDGCVWAALPNEKKVARIEEGGKILEEILLNETPLCCGLGGEARKTLFIVTVPAHSELSADELSGFDAQRQKKASRILCTPVGVSGAGAP